VNHAIPNDERRQPFVVGAAQNAKHVVLLDGDPAVRDHLGKMSLDDGGRSQNAHGDFGLHRVKRTALGDFFANTAAAVPILARGWRARHARPSHRV
jgi:hypothetical protein